MMMPSKLPDVPFRWSDLHHVEVSRWRFDELIREGRVREVFYGVYQRSDLPDTLENRAHAALLVVRPFVVLCDRTAAWLHGVDTFDLRELEILPPLETFVLRHHSRVRRDGCYPGQRDLRPRDICTIKTLQATTPLRTALDLGCSLGRRSALAALDAFQRLHGITREQMEAELPRYRRRRGVVQLRQLVPLADPLAESTGESWTRIAIHDAGLPAPEPQFWVLEGGRKVFRLDLAYPLSKVAVEYDGREFHESQESRAADRRRRRWLSDRGWTVIVVDKYSFSPEALAGWLDELRTALRLVS